MPEPLLQVERLSKRYPVTGRRGALLHAVADVSLHIAAGESLGLVGESEGGSAWDIGPEPLREFKQMLRCSVITSLAGYQTFAQPVLPSGRRRWADGSSPRQGREASQGQELTPVDANATL